MDPLAGAGQGDLLLQQLHRLPGAPGEDPVPGRRHGEDPARSHPERFGIGRRPDGGRHPRELPAGRRFRPDPGGAPALHGRDGPDRKSKGTFLKLFISTTTHLLAILPPPYPMRVVPEGGSRRVKRVIWIDGMYCGSIMVLIRTYMYLR